MPGRSSDPAAHRTSPGAAVRARPSRRQALALATVFALAAGGVTAAALLVRPDDARSFDLFDGSVLLADAVAPVAVDLASGQPTVRLVDAGAQVGARRADDVAVVPMREGALLVDRRSGQFNLVDPTGFVVKKDGGVPLARQSGTTTAFARATSSQLAYITRTGAQSSSGAQRSSVYLVSPGTVQGASSGTVRPRAFTELPEPVRDVPGSAATAGNDLWLLSGTDGTRTVRRLSLPANSAPGVALRDREAGRVTGPAAIATAGNTVAVAGEGSLRLWRGDTEVRSVTTPDVAGLDTVLPASHTSARLAFLLHGTSGWHLLSVARDGTDVRGPTRVDGIAADARLVAPAYSQGSLYTADAGNGALWRIELDARAAAITGAASYPVVTQGGRAIEAGGFDDTTVYSQGPRVVVNSPNHLRAVVLFTDGSRAPVAFTKSDATTISSGGGAEALTRGRNREAPQRTPTPGRSQPVPRPVNPINNQVDCTSTSQTPHIPALNPPVPGSRSVQLSWTYPVTDRTDCVPRTYVVGVQQVAGDGPAPPARVTVNGQLGVNLTGLYPSSRYAVTVTAYLNGKGTSSAPIRVTTGPAGPTAPSGVTAAVDAGGVWTVAWRGCVGAGRSCVPAASWRVVPQVCDDRGLTGAPENVEVVADPTTAVQPTARVGGAALLGRSLRFSVQGIGASGAIGAPSAATACSTSWAAPQTGALRLTASTPGDVGAGSTTTTTLSLNLGSDPARAAGGLGATVTFALDGPGGVRTRTAAVDGRSGVLTATFDGVRPGASYVARARVEPPGHPEAGVDLEAGSVTTRAQWPGLGVVASCEQNSLLTCGLVVRFTGLSRENTGGERIALAEGSTLRCGNATLPLAGDDLAASGFTVTVQYVSQLAKLFGACSVDVGLVESGGNAAPLYFGGVPSAGVSVGVDLGAARSADVAASELSAAWSEQGGSSARLAYTGKADLGQLTTDWTSTLVAPNGTACGMVAGAPDPAFVPAGTCARQYGDRTTGWKVVTSYTDRTDGDRHEVTVAVDDGAPPGYVACTPTFGAAWGATRDAGVAVTADGDTGGCTDFTIRLVSGASTECGAADGAATATLAITCADPADGAWSVAVSWTNPDGTKSNATIDDITGDPPLT